MLVSSCRAGTVQGLTITSRPSWCLVVLTELPGAPELGVCCRGRNCSYWGSTVKHVPYFLYPKDFLFTLPFTVALPGLVPVISPFLPFGSAPGPSRSRIHHFSLRSALPVPLLPAGGYRSPGTPRFPELSWSGARAAPSPAPAIPAGAGGE